MTSPLKQIIKKLDEIDKSKKWFATDAHIKQVIDNQYQEVRIAFYQNPEMQVSGEKINLVEIDLNEIKSLTAALRMACESLHKTQDYYKSTNFCKLNCDDVCNFHQAECVITEMNINILNKIAEKLKGDL